MTIFEISTTNSEIDITLHVLHTYIHTYIHTIFEIKNLFGIKLVVVWQTMMRQTMTSDVIELCDNH